MVEVAEYPKTDHWEYVFVERNISFSLKKNTFVNIGTRFYSKFTDIIILTLLFFLDTSF